MTQTKSSRFSDATIYGGGTVKTVKLSGSTSRGGLQYAVTPDFVVYKGAPAASSAEPDVCPYFDEITIAVQTLKEEFKQLKEILREGAAPFCTFIASLGLPELEIKKPIPVTIRPDGDSVIASFLDANISAGGDTLEDAICNLQSLIADVFDMHAQSRIEQLGPSMRRQRAVLMEFVCRT